MNKTSIIKWVHASVILHTTPPFSLNMVVGLEGQAGQGPCHIPSLCQPEHCVAQSLILGYGQQ